MKNTLCPLLAISLTLPAFAIGNDSPFLNLFDGKLSVRAGGEIKVTASFDWGNPINNPNSFIISEIPMDLSPGNGGKFQISAQQSGIYIDLRWLEGDKDEIGLFANGQLLGDNYNFQLEEAYLTYRGLKAGYGYGIFCDQDAVFPTIGHQGPNSFISVTNGILDYEYTFKSGISIGIGIEMPIESISTGSDASAVSNRIPDIPAYIQYSFGTDNESWIRASTIIRTLVYRDNISAKNRNIAGWGIKLSGSSTIFPRLRTYYMVGYGSGISSYFQDLTDSGLDLLPEAGNPGRMQTNRSWGGYAGLSYNITDRLTATGGYSYLRTYPDNFNTNEWNDLYRNGQYATVNLIYNINSHFNCGMEYIYGQRVNMSGISGHDNRIQTMLSFSF